jgi:hypothetical protein
VSVILRQAESSHVIDASGKVVAPGFTDAHVHGDLMVLADPLQEAGIRQGVTTYVLGQDGVAMAPALPATLEYMRQYTAGFSGIPELRLLFWKPFPLSNGLGGGGAGVVVLLRLQVVDVDPLSAGARDGGAHFSLIETVSAEM